MSKYIPTIGIECHVQLKTKTKLFAAVGNDAREAPPNTLVSHICFGMPGALPVLNQAAVDLAVKAAFALKTKPQAFSKFDRKHYFYPDLPKGYQITQYDQPIIVGGQVDINVDGQTKSIHITRAHLEEDAGKSTHPAGKDYSLVDLNRAGTPLLEIVSEPEMHSAAEAKAYAYELYLLMKYAGVSDADLYYGNMRFDVNVSVSMDPNKLGTRTETKNLNSFRSVEKAVEYEIKRQTELLEKGEKVIQETRGWHDDKQKTFSQRSKEEAQDYRYFPDADIPPIVLTEKQIAKAAKSMPTLPDEYREKLKGIGIDSLVVEDIVAQPNIAKGVMEALKKSNPDHAKRIAFWLLWKSGPEIEAGTNVHNAPVASLIGIDRLIKLSQMVADSKLSSTAAKDVVYEMINNRQDPEKIATEKNLIQVSDKSELESMVEQVLKENPKAAEDIKKGEVKAIGFLVGQVMKLSKGQANPQIVQQIIKKQLKI